MSARFAILTGLSLTAMVAFIFGISESVGLGNTFAFVLCIPFLALVLIMILSPETIGRFLSPKV